MEKTTLYTALIEDNNGIHIIRKDLPDSDPAAFEDFELYVNSLSRQLDGDLFGPYGADDVLEDTTLPEGPCPTIGVNSDDDSGASDTSEVDELLKKAAQSNWEMFDRLPIRIRDGVLAFYEPGVDYSDDSPVWDGRTDDEFATLDEFRRACQMYDWLITNIGPRD